ncbi:DUF6457 domain-containing protein [Couchioplanes azureus]|uniref:DUF6457 domain-containing protein n=1 Tax=Couchioplanes caeruleus TaxID=56438 RepID=UPI001670CF2A|nr:DUF6457 domain-containing protein [Couchioplanes caeruleus]GGQ45287.1 hypothetical protein GCM10010166_12340 [Couchioplanes caeruleus subsp. azureus]
MNVLDEWIKAAAAELGLSATDVAPAADAAPGSTDVAPAADAAPGSTDVAPAADAAPGSTDVAREAPSATALVLDVARDVAHNVVRPGAPISTYLMGLAVGRGADPADVAARLSELAKSWPTGDR